MKIYTRKGDDGTTGLFYGGRVRKDEAGPEAYGTVDEAVAVIGVARASAEDATLAARLLAVQRDLFVMGAELATLPENRGKLEPGVSLVSDDMVGHLEAEIDDVVDRKGLPSEFIVPGENPLAAAIDLARAVVRRAERKTVAYVAAAGIEDSRAPQYLNRLADYLCVLTRAAESVWVPSRTEEES